MNQEKSRKFRSLFYGKINSQVQSSPVPLLLQIFNDARRIGLGEFVRVSYPIL